MSNFSNYIFFLTPFITWFITGCTKFLVNSIRSKSLALSQIGYGGFPSNHSAIVSSMAMLIGLREGFDHPAFGVAMALTFIVVMDANGLRMKMSQHAQQLNQLNKNTDTPLLRERIGHTKIEIIGGVLMGMLCAYIINTFSLVI